MDLVTIITPSYDSGRFISTTIKSVLSQAYTNWEMLIVDDCSKDNSVEIVSGFAKNEKRIKLIELKKNVGAAEARNVAIREAKGRFIAFLDSDDLWHPKKLEHQIAFMQKENVAFSYTAYQLINSVGSLLNKTIEVPEAIDYSGYLKNTIIGCLTVMIDRSQTGNFEMPNIRSSHDMALWLLIMKRGFKAYGINEVLGYYRLVSSSNTANKWKAAKDVWRVYNKIENINIIKSSYYFSFYVLNAIKKRL